MESTPKSFRRGQLAERFWQWRLRLAGRELKEPGCGACGYPVQGLAGTTCPECGADQLAVGVSVPVDPIPRWGGTVAWGGGWLVVVALLATLLNPVLLEGVPRGMSNHRDYLLRPRSASFDTISVRRIGYGFGSPWLPFAPEKSERGWIVTSKVGGPFHQLDYEVARGTHSTSGGNGRLDLPSLLALLEQWGADTSRADVQSEAAELLALVQTRDFAASPESNLKQFTLISPVRGAPQWVPKRRTHWLAVTGWAVVFVAGCVAIDRWRRRNAPVRGFSLEPVDPA